MDLHENPVFGSVNPLPHVGSSYYPAFLKFFKCAGQKIWSGFLTSLPFFSFLVYILFIPIALFSKAKIYDCFPFFNELELLEIRLNEMYPVVDYFVLVECSETFRGTLKPLMYNQNKERFKQYSDKIIHIIVEERLETDNPWIREEFQKNQIKRGLKHCSSQDIIIIGDLDEIIRASDLERFIEPVLYGKKKAVAATQRFFRWYLNRRSKELPFWTGSVVSTYGYLKKKSFHQLREKKDNLPKIHDVGWHFSNMGGMAQYIKKLESFSHAEADTAENKDPRTILAYTQQQLDLETIDETFPRYVQKYQSELLQMGMIDFSGNMIYR